MILFVWSFVIEAHLPLVEVMADTTQVSGNFWGKFGVKLPSLGALNLGYTNPALAQGLAGFILNPASLSEIEHPRLSTAVGFGSESKLKLLPTVDMGKEIGFVEIPCELSFTQPMSMNTMSFGFNHNHWAFGLGFIEEFGINATTNGTVTFFHEFSDTIPYALTHADIPKIPEEDTIPIALSLTTPIEIPLNGGAGFDWSENKIFLGVARGIGWFRAGIGVIYRPIRANLGIGLATDLSAPCTLKCDVTSGEWEADAIGNTKIEEKVFDAGGEVELKGDGFDLVAGMTLDFGVLKLAGTLEAVPKTVLNVTGGTWATYITDLPSIDSIYPEGVEVDTIQNKISGVIGVRFSEFPDTTETSEWEEEYELGGRVGIGFGSAVEVGPFTGGSLRTNSLSALASVVKEVEEKEPPRLFELFSPAIGIDLKFE